MHPNRTGIPEDIGTIVIGAGAGGAAAASVLARSGESVLLLEAGPDYGPFAAGGWPAEMLDARSVPLSHDYTLMSRTSDGTPPADLARARIVGGCTAHNGCTASLSSAFDYDEWERLGNPGWGSDEVRPLLDWVHERFRVRRYGMDELTRPQRAFVEAGLASGLPFADDLDAMEAAEGIGPMPVNIVDGVRWNSAFAFLDDIRELPNLTILGGATARRIEMDHGAVRGVTIEIDGRSTLIEADRVVLAAGAYHSPALLLASGIGPGDELRSLGLEVRRDLPGVGRHLLDHACVQLNFRGEPGLADEIAALEWGPDEQSLGRVRSSLCDDPESYDIHVFMVAGENSGHPHLPAISLYGGAMRARSEGTVTLGTDLDVVTPVIDHRYGSDPDGHDRQVLREALELLTAMTEQPVLASVLGERVGAEDPLARIVSYCHPAGTCKMGPATDERAVVDHSGKVHGVDGLYVADASIMPVITRGNINLPTAMIGARVGLGLLGTDPEAFVAAHSRRAAPAPPA